MRYEKRCYFDVRSKAYMSRVSWCWEPMLRSVCPSVQLSVCPTPLVKWVHFRAICSLTLTDNPVLEVEPTGQPPVRTVTGSDRDNGDQAVSGAALCPQNKSVFNIIRQLPTCHCQRLLLSAVFRRCCCWAPGSNRSISPVRWVHNISNQSINNRLIHKMT